MRKASLGILNLLLLTCVVTASAQGTLEDYKRAEALLPWSAEKLFFSGNVEPSFINDDDDAFIYRSSTREAERFILVDPTANTRAPAFDHARLARALRAADRKEYDAAHLELRHVEFLDGRTKIRFMLDQAAWICDLNLYVCSKTEHPGPAAHELASPDGRWIAYLKDHNVFVRSTVDGEVVQLSHDGRESYDYGREDYTPDFVLKDSEKPEPPRISAIWSPDSRKLFTYRTDHRQTGPTYVLQSVVPNGGMRTQLHAYPYPLPGDETLPTLEPVVFDVEQRKQTDIAARPLFAPLMSWRLPRGFWTEDSKKVYFIDMMRGYKAGYLIEADANTGQARRIIEERSVVLVDHNVQLLALIDNGEQILWSSERDGWNHLYLYDGRTGKLLRQVTKGQWPVREVVHVDEQNRVVYFTAGGREAGDPYLRRLYRISLDGTGLKLLTPEDADHDVTMSPTGRFFIDVYSKVNTAPVAVLRRSSDGEVVQVLETGDLEQLLASGWRFPEPFRAKAADGKTSVYGVLFKPVNFDPSQEYPIIENIYSGPHWFNTPKRFPMSRRESRPFFTSQSVANLGFIVMVMDGRGQNARGTAFRNHQYRNLADAGLEDRIAAMKQLAERHDYIDIRRVGIFGYSAGGYAAARAMLSHPEFYKVGVSSAGNHDHRMDKLSWNERWMGYPVGEHYHEQSNVTHAAQLQGKLLLTYGDLDTNVPPASTLKLVHALIEANKDFDLLVFPNRGHYLEEDPYFIRRRWDYFVEHLLDVDPPPFYEVKKPNDD